MTSKSSSEFDLRRKVVVVLKKSHSPATPGSPKTPNSANSFQGPREFFAFLIKIEVTARKNAQGRSYLLGKQAASSHEPAFIRHSPAHSAIMWYVSFLYACLRKLASFVADIR